MTPHALISPARLAGIPLLRTQTDERLVDLVRAGNDAAFEAVVARYRRPLLRYCSRLLSTERAEDVVQQAFLRAYDALRASSGEMHLKAWLYRIAHNTALNALRDGGAGHEELSEQIDGVERPDQAYEKSQRLREVLAAVGSLPARQRDAIVLRELEGRSYDEIAAELGVSAGAVRQLLNRARTTLRAGATAVTPAGLLVRVPLGSESADGVAARVAELCAAGTGGAVATKVCATALVTGAVFGGVATAPQDGDEGSARPSRDRGAATAADTTAGELERFAASRERTGAASNAARSRRDGDADRSDRSGPEHGDDERSSSGPGPGGDDRGGSNSGPGSTGGPGSSSGGSGSEVTGGSGSSGSDSSGSGSSGPGSGETVVPDGAGSSGSGSSGSGSGSGSEDPDLPDDG